MRYTSNEKLDFDEINKKAKSTGFSDKARKYLSSVLLGIHILGAVPSFANEVQATEYDYLPQGPQFEEVLDYDNDKDAQLNKIVDAYGKIAEIDRSDIKTFKDRTSGVLREKIPNDGKVKVIKSINDITIEYLMQLKEKGETLIGFSDKGELELRDCYSIDDMIKIKQYYEKYYGPIRDNPNLTQQEKFIAAMNVLSYLNTYDHQAYRPINPTEYSKAAFDTSRNQFSTVMYGKTICIGFADSVLKVANMLGVDCKVMHGFYGNAESFGKLAPEVQENVLSAMDNGEKITARAALNHAVNMVTFDDGTSYMVDMTFYDQLKEANNDKIANQVMLKGLNGDAPFFAITACGEQLILENPEDRDAVSKCQSMSFEQIENANEKAMQELPYIKALQELDEEQRKNNFTKEKTSALYKMKMNFDKFMDKMFGPKTDLLPSGADDIIKNNIESLLNSQHKIQSDNIQQNQQTEIVNSDMVMNREEEIELAMSSDAENEKENNEPTNTNQNDFKTMIAGNGQYRRTVEEYMKNYENQERDKQDKVVEQDEMEM